MADSSIWLHDSLPAIVQVLDADWSPEGQQTHYDQAFTLLEEVTEPVYLISDMREVHMGLESIIEAANRFTKGTELRRLSGHPMIKATILVTTDGMIKLAAKGMNTVTFGNFEFPVYDSLEDAYEHVRRVEGMV